MKPVFSKDIYQEEEEKHYTEESLIDWLIDWLQLNTFCKFSFF